MASLKRTTSFIIDAKPASTWRLLQRVRDTSPLVHCITNFVSAEILANVLLAAGASPAMMHSAEEVEDCCDLAGALLVNVGTLDSGWLAAARLAAVRAGATGKVWVLDPVGCGATPYRTAACRRLAALRPTLIRGNPAEISALAGGGPLAPTKGVDSAVEDAAEALGAARELATRYDTVVAVSGPVDYVTDGRRVLRVANGVPLLTAVTGMGCSVTALCAAFCAAAPGQPLEAAAHALALFGVAAEAAGARSQGPGTLRGALLDCLHGAAQEQVLAASRVSEHD